MKKDKIEHVNKKYHYSILTCLQSAKTEIHAEEDDGVKGDVSEEDGAQGYRDVGDALVHQRD